MNSDIEVLTLPVDTSKTGMRQLLDLLRSLMPVLDNIKTTVENSSSKIPKATEQLSTVTQATENATMEILNFLDDIGRRIEAVQGKLQGAEADLTKKQESIGILETLFRSFPAEQRAAWEQAAPAWATLTDLTQHTAAVTESRTELADIHSLSMNIAMALQVQDITSQQIESVRHQIESVRMQLTHVVGVYEGKLDDAVPTVPIHRPFDGDAEYSKDESRQADADSIIAQFTQQNGAFNHQ